jgi:hypothetical protein
MPKVEVFEIEQTSQLDRTNSVIQTLLKEAHYICLLAPNRRGLLTEFCCMAYELGQTSTRYKSGIDTIKLTMLGIIDHNVQHHK